MLSVLVLSVTAARSPLIRICGSTQERLALHVCMCEIPQYRFSGEKNGGSCSHH